MLFRTVSFKTHQLCSAEVCDLYVHVCRHQNIFRLFGAIVIKYFNNLTKLPGYLKITMNDTNSIVQVLKRENNFCSIKCSRLQRKIANLIITIRLSLVIPAQTNRLQGIRTFLICFSSSPFGANSKQ